MAMLVRTLAASASWWPGPAGMQCNDVSSHQTHDTRFWDVPHAQHCAMRAHFWQWPRQMRMETFHASIQEVHSGSRLTCVFDADTVKLEMLFVLGPRGGLPRRRVEIDIVGHASPSPAVNARRRR